MMIDTVPLIAEGLHKSFGGTLELSRFLPWRHNHEKPAPIKVLDDVSFEIRPSEIYGIIGANGSGKSTLVRILSTLLLPGGGQVRIFGFDVVRESMEVRRLINRVSADPSFFKVMSAEENLLFFGKVYGLSPQEIRERTPPILERLGLTWRQATGPMKHLSRGQQQKVAVARAFLTSPVLMLLDEPTTGLDPRSKRDVQAFIQEVRAEHDATVLLTTHDMAEAEQLCDRIAVLASGRIVVEGTPLELRRSVAGERPLESVNMETVYLELTGKSIEEEEIRPGQEAIVG